ncbi:MAG: hypothetical protein LBV54_04600, partial [Puniceicoccales bacterium]|nr:hypothetical protein [Puniceicoccales bacterium]
RGGRVRWFFNWRSEIGNLKLFFNHGLHGYLGMAVVIGTGAWKGRRLFFIHEFHELDLKKICENL